MKTKEDSLDTAIGIMVGLLLSIPIWVGIFRLVFGKWFFE